MTLKGVQTLKNEKSTIKDKEMFDLITIKYFELSNVYCLNSEAKQGLVNEFQNVLGIDILNLYETLSPLGLTSPFFKMLPETSNETRQ